MCVRGNLCRLLEAIRDGWTREIVAGDKHTRNTIGEAVKLGDSRYMPGPVLGETARPVANFR